MVKSRLPLPIEVSVHHDSMNFIIQIYECNSPRKYEFVLLAQQQGTNLYLQTVITNDPIEGFFSAVDICLNRAYRSKGIVPVDISTYAKRNN